MGFFRGHSALSRRSINEYQKHPGTGARIGKGYRLVSYFNYLVWTILFQKKKTHTTLKNGGHKTKKAITIRSMSLSELLLKKRSHHTLLELKRATSLSVLAFTDC